MSAHNRRLAARLNALLMLLSMIVFTGNGTIVRAGGWSLPEKGAFAKLSYLSSTASSYREADGSEVIFFRDYDSTRKRYRNYSTEFSGGGAGLYGEYGLFERLTLTFDIPFSRFSLEETYSLDDLHPTYETRRNMSITQASWMGFGARWQAISGGKFVAALSGCVRIPPGFSSPDTGNVDFQFLSDGTLQVIGGLEMGVSFDGAWLETEAKYNMRGGDFTDEVLLHFEAGFSNIPRTYLKTFADAVISVKNFDGVRPFNVAQSQLQETTYNFGGSFTAFITENWFLDASYSLRLWCYNSWILSSVTLGCGIKLPGEYENEQAAIR